MISPDVSVLGLGFLASEAGLAWWKRSSRASGTREADDGSLRLLWRVIACAVTVGILLSVYGVGPRLPARLHWNFVGAGVFAVGTVLRWWAIRHLGRFFTVDVALASDHRVVDTGPYRWVRHPSYTGLLLQFAGLAAAMDNVLSMVVILVPTVLALCRRIHVEETALRATLGEAYAEYARSHRRLVPGVY